MDLDLINTLPQDGLLQYHNGISWTPVTIGQTISRSAIESGLFCFGPDANESGFDGNALVGTGNLRNDYAQFSYQATDGKLRSADTSFTIDVTPVADAPSVILSAPAGSIGAQSEFFRTTGRASPIAMYCLGKL